MGCPRLIILPADDVGGSRRRPSRHQSRAHRVCGRCRSGSRHHSCAGGSGKRSSRPTAMGGVPPRCRERPPAGWIARRGARAS